MILAGSVVAAVPAHLFTSAEPLWAKVVRTVVVYGGIVGLLRLAGKRDLAQLNSLDLVVLLLLSNVVQNAIIGDDLSLQGGLFGAAVLIGVNAVLVRTVRRNAAVARVLEGQATVLVHEGAVDQAAVRRLGLSESDLMAALRRQGARVPTEVKRAALEPGGSISVELWPGDMDATKGDMARLEAKLDAILAAIPGPPPPAG